MGIAVLFGLAALYVFFSYYYYVEMHNHQIVAGFVLFGLACWLLFHSFDDYAPRWTMRSIAGLLMLLAVLPFWQAHRAKSSGTRRRTMADKLFYYSMVLALVLALVLTAIR